jgi:hypothetical protein
MPITKEYLFNIATQSREKAIGLIETAIQEHPAVPPNLRDMGALKRSIDGQQISVGVLRTEHAQLLSRSPLVLRGHYEQARKTLIQRQAEAVNRQYICDEIVTLLSTWNSLSTTLNAIRQNVMQEIAQMRPEIPEGYAFVEDPSDEEILAWADQQELIVRGKIGTAEENLRNWRSALVDIEVMQRQFKLESAAQWKEKLAK